MTTHPDTDGNGYRWDEQLRQWVPAYGDISPAEMAADQAFRSQFVAQAQTFTGTEGAVITQTDGTDDNTFALKITDNAGNGGRLLHLDHYGAGDSQSYALDIRNRTGAQSAAVIHQYSDLANTTAIQIDNTNSRPFITMKNTENGTLSPGTFGSGAYLDLYGGSTGDTHRVALLTASLTLQTFDTTRPFTVAPQAAMVGLQVAQAYGAVALSVEAGAGAAGFYVASFSGRDYGPRIVTSQNSGVSLIVQKDGTGAGTVAQVINKGTGLSLDIRSGAASLFAVSAAGLPQWVAAGNQQTTVGAAGGASALPATPTKYLKVVDSAGTTLVVPAYAAA